MRSRSVILLAAITIVVAVTGCDQSKKGTHPSTTEAGVSVAVANTPRLVGGAESVDDLVSQSLVAFSMHDTASLAGLLVTHDEFMSYIYPELGKYYPAARDTSLQAREFIWENQGLSTLAALRTGLRDIGGKKLDLVEVMFTEGTKSFDGYTIHEETRVKVRQEDGTETELHTMGSIVEMDGRYKFLTYRDRD
jgi:hypothetical protein